MLIGIIIQFMLGALITIFVIQFFSEIVDFFKETRVNMQLGQSDTIIQLWIAIIVTIIVMRAVYLYL